jgi:hypothetical protein
MAFVSAITDHTTTIPEVCGSTSMRRIDIREAGHRRIAVNRNGTLSVAKFVNSRYAKRTAVTISPIEPKTMLTCLTRVAMNTIRYHPLLNFPG